MRSDARRAIEGRDGVTGEPRAPVAHDQPTPRLGIIVVESLASASADHRTEPDELLWAPPTCRLEHGALTRCGRSFTLGHRHRG